MNKELIDKLKKYLEDNDLTFNIENSNVDEDKLKSDFRELSKAYLDYFPVFLKCFHNMEDNEVEDLIDFNRVTIYPVVLSKYNRMSGVMGNTNISDLRNFVSNKNMEMLEVIDICEEINNASSGGF